MERLAVFLKPALLYLCLLTGCWLQVQGYLQWPISLEFAFLLMSALIFIGLAHLGKAARQVVEIENGVVAEYRRGAPFDLLEGTKPAGILAAVTTIFLLPFFLSNLIELKRWELLLALVASLALYIPLIRGACARDDQKESTP